MNPQSKWLPLQSDPQIINEFAVKLGMKDDFFCFQELVSIEEWAQSMISQPVLGIIFLYEQNEGQLEYKKEQGERLNPNEIGEDIFFMQQFADYACGTIAIFHLLLNWFKKIPSLVEEGSILNKFYQESGGKTSQQIGKLFQESQNIQQKHSEAVSKGQTLIPEEEVQEHFIALIQKNGRIYELDGCKKCPVDHGQCTQEELLRVGCQVVQQFMKRDPEGNNFSVIVLGKKGEQQWM